MRLRSMHKYIGWACRNAVIAESLEIACIRCVAMLTITDGSCSPFPDMQCALAIRVSEVFISGLYSSSC